MKCTKCGNELVEGAKFCTRCGNKIVYSHVENNVQENKVEEKNQSEWKEDKGENGSDKKGKFTYFALAIAIIVAGAAGMLVRSWRNQEKNIEKQVTLNSKETKGVEVSEMEEDNALTEDGEAVETDFEDVGETESEKEEPKKVSTYQYVQKDISWTDAEQEAEAAGGHLAVITSDEEYKTICEIADNSGLTYIWLGAKLDFASENWQDVGWITGETWTYDKWYPNEPSKIDSSDNVEELYLCMWNAKYNGNDVGWTFNDQRNDIVAAFPSVSGRIGYIIEFEE